ncbi:VHS-domain-containing protein [Russula earlei]|uniref:VHS-domain-containing protein n=1 Tax=Russula earlei TaxID=71964 RepID=A0ACC0UCU3_9AGAM|nr:VHS-domain-containing protein [Russula earlei]
MWNNPPGNWPRASQLEFLITRATTAAQPDNNYALHIEIAEHINSKKANTPREAAMLIVQAVNHRNPHVSLLALGLLDTLVQMCGYPFHLQISTKEFLNELVRRFPERPPPFPGPVMSRVLELIHGWKEGICAESRWRDDLGNIRDMHRLLSFKGYRFRDIPRTPSVPTTSNLKSAEELESEDREAQSAKLQELIRRGTPRDLAAAQELMKSLAGANPEAKPDYRSQALSELNKLEQKVILLHEILDNVDTERGETFAKGDVYDQVATILLNSRPKIQKWISDAESDDPESLDTYLQTNDQINSVLARYEAFKRGETPPASIPEELLGKNEPNSLIDFDDAPPQLGSSSGAGSISKPGDDLAGLFESSTSIPATSPPVAAPSGGFGISPLVPNSINHQTYAISPQFSSSPPGTSPPSSRPQSQFGQIKLPSTPPLQSQQQGLGRGGLPGTSSPLGTARASASSKLTATNTLQQALAPQAAPLPPISQASTPQRKDPFADLAGLF